MLAARVGSTVAKGAFMQKFENGVFWLLKGTEKVRLWGVKSPCYRPCDFQNLLASAERAAMAPLGSAFCVQSALPFAVFLLTGPFLITFFQKMLLAAAGNTFLQNDFKHYALANPLFAIPKLP